eukprot:jgi/Psemu1/46160/gm1.46160_g
MTFTQYTSHQIFCWPSGRDSSYRSNDPYMREPVLALIGHRFNDPDDIHLVQSYESTNRDTKTSLCLSNSYDPPIHDRTCDPFYARPIYVHPGVYARGLLERFCAIHFIQCYASTNQYVSTIMPVDSYDLPIIVCLQSIFQLQSLLHCDYALQLACYDWQLVYNRKMFVWSVFYLHPISLYDPSILRLDLRLNLRFNSTSSISDLFGLVAYIPADVIDSGSGGVCHNFHDSSPGTRYSSR